ncbi:unnamed protein product [Caenorhabditis brenneri]
MRMKLLIWLLTQHLIMVNLASSETAPESSWSVPSWSQLSHLSHRIRRASIDFWLQPLDKYFEDQSAFTGTRVERDSNEDAFSTLQSRISSLARVVTGVTLYNGLVEGTIPIDETIGELMNTGPINFEQLEKFNDKQVNNYVEKLKQVSTEMGDDSKTIEEALSDMAKMKAMWNDVGDLDGIPDETKFKELNVMGGLDISTFVDFDVDDAMKKVNGKSGFPALIDSLKKIAKQSNKAKEKMKQKKALETFEEMTPFYKYVELTKYYKGDSIGTLGENDQNVRNALKADIEKLVALKDGDSSKLTMLEALTKSQFVGNRIDRKYSSGFVNGFVDLKQLPTDSKNQWILNRFGWLKLEDGLKDVSNLEKEMAGLNDKWKPLKKDSILKAVEKAATMEIQLEEAVDVTKIYESVLNQFTNNQVFNFPFINQDTLTKRMTISRAATQLFRKGKAIERISDITEKRHDAITKLDASSQPSIDAFVNLLEALRPYLQVIKDGGTLKDLTDNLLKNPNKYANINKDDATTKTFFKALKATSKDFDELAAVADLAMKFRELKSDTTFGKNIKEASKIASESSTPIKSIRTAMENIKTSSTDKTKMLPQLKGLQTFSKPLGDSVAVIVKMRKILDKKNALIKFVTNGHVIDTMADTTTDSAIKDTVRKTWVGFEEISQKCMSLFGEVKKRKDGVVKPNDDKLESYGSIIEGLGGLTDVDLHGNDRMIAIQALLPIADSKQKTQLTDLQNSLTELLPLDMTFARHTSSLPGMSGVLTGIAGVFGSVGPKPTVKPVPIAAQTASPRRGNQAGGLRMSTVETTTEKDNGITTRDLIVGGGSSFVTCILTVAAVLGIQKLQKWRKQVAKVKKEKKNSTETAKESGSQSVTVTASSSNTNGTSTPAQSTGGSAAPSPGPTGTGTTTTNTPGTGMTTSKNPGTTTQGTAGTGTKTSKTARTGKKTEGKVSAKQIIAGIWPKKIKEYKEDKGTKTKQPDATASAKKSGKAGAADPTKGAELKKYEDKEVTVEGKSKGTESWSVTKSVKSLTKRVFGKTPKKEEWLLSQSDDDTLRCVKSICN